jgi:phytoene dehydrogenase-like protein
MKDGAYDAVVVGSGPNGLAAAVTLSGAGLRVLVLEGAGSPGGGCRTKELTLPGFKHDVCSAAHPLALASPFFKRFDLVARGVRLLQPEVPYAHPLDGGRAGVVTRSLSETAARLGPDGPAYQRIFGSLARHGDDLAEWILSAERSVPSRPLLLGLYGARGMRPASAVVRRYRTDEARALFAGVAAHAMRPLTTAPTAAIGMFLGALAHSVGWPIVEGGSGRLVEVMVAAIERAGGAVETGHWVRSLDELPPAKATLLDITPRQLLAIAGDRLPLRYRHVLERFRYGSGICKVDFALSGPVPWQNEDCRRAGSVHVGGTFEEIARAEAAVSSGQHPSAPYVLVVQPSLFDQTRAPRGQHALWAYCHVPSGSGVDMSAALISQVERFAPGFRDLILAKAVRTAQDQEAYDPNCVGGDIASGLQNMRQTLLRPGLRWNPYRTPLRGVYMCSASTTPGPGVHGRCGELAARSALRDVFRVEGARHLAPAA